MRRKDFIKGCLALGFVPFLPEFRGGKEKLLSKVYASAFRQKKGICYGFWHEDRGEIEIVMLDYKRIPYDQNMLKNIRKHVDFGRRKKNGRRYWWARNEKEYYANERLVKMLQRQMKYSVYPLDGKEIERDERLIRPRLEKWGKWLSGHLGLTWG